MLQLRTIDSDTYSLLQEISGLDFLNSFSLAGGTSLALQLGHRKSIDLDLFTLHEFDSEKLLDQLLHNYKISNASLSTNTLSLYIYSNKKNIKVEFLRHNYKLLKEIQIVNNIRLYSIEDIAAMKLNAVANRGSKKDFYDIYQLLNKFSITELLDLFSEKYKSSNAFTVVKSLSYFEDADLEPEPMSLIDVDWNTIKKKLSKEVSENF